MKDAFLFVGSINSAREEELFEIQLDQSIELNQNKSDKGSRVWRAFHVEPYAVQSTIVNSSNCTRHPLCKVVFKLFMQRFHRSRNLEILPAILTLCCAAVDAPANPLIE